MTTTETKQSTTAGRRVGYVIGIAINAAFLWLIHIWPGWDVVPFLTADFEIVLWLVDLSLVASIAVNVVYLIRDPRWLTAAGAVVTTAVGLAGAVRMLQVFPFDFGDSDVWPVVFRVLLWVGIVGSIIGIITNLVSLVRALGAR